MNATENRLRFLKCCAIRFRENNSYFIARSREKSFITYALNAEQFCRKKIEKEKKKVLLLLNCALKVIIFNENICRVQCTFHMNEN